jgi:8-oxo-dGTP pyrophosphatase MutT (NUDIX family)
MKRYVMGFYMSPDGTVLIEKTEGRFRGLVNGLGGKMEPGEGVQEAMAREFFEESGVATEPCFWQPVVTLTGSDYVLHILRAFGILPTAPIPECEEGKVGLYATLPAHMEATARWLWYLCNDHTLPTCEVQGVVREYGGVW